MNKASKPNVLLIMTDQQRWDCLSAAAGGWGHTPNLDRLAAEGVYFEQCYCAAPSCVPSRASFFNLQSPSQLGAMKNGDRWSPSWVEQFRQAGYRTLNVGKMHTQPFDVPGGFDQRFIVENKDRSFFPRFYDDWERHLKQRGIQPPNRHTYKHHPHYETALGAYQWELPTELHWDYFVAQTAEWVIAEHDERPLFMQLGFPGPHTPYDPPPAYLDRVDKDQIPLPVAYDPDKDIPPHRDYRQIMIEGNHGGVKWSDNPSPEQLRKLRHYYAADMAMIDERIGAVLDALKRKGLLDDLIVVFTSDHGDTLGDHGQIQKWTMFDSVMRIPAIVWAPGRLQGGIRCDQLIQQMDLVPMLFKLAGVPLADSGEAHCAGAVLDGEQPARDCVFAEHGKCNMLPAIEHMGMVRTREWKLVAYADREYGELYNLTSDPQEVENRWGNPAYQAIQRELEERLAEHRRDPVLTH